MLPGRSFGLPFGSLRPRRGRCFLPTSAADFRNEHPWTVRVSSAREYRADRASFRSKSETAEAPGRFLTVAQPRVDARLTSRLQLQSYRPPLAFEKTCGAPRLVGLSGRGVISHVPGWRPTSDAPCRASTSPGNPSGLEEPAPLPPPPRQKERSLRLRAPSTDKCSQERLPPHPLKEPATVIGILPPQSSFRRCFAPAALALEG